MRPEVSLFIAGVFVGAMIGIVVVGLLLAANDRLRVVGRWQGSKGTELIDTSDGRRWCCLGQLAEQQRVLRLTSAGEPPICDIVEMAGSEKDQPETVREEFVRVLQ